MSAASSRRRLTPSSGAAAATANSRPVTRAPRFARPDGGCLARKSLRRASADGQADGRPRERSVEPHHRRAAAAGRPRVLRERRGRARVPGGLAAHPRAQSGIGIYSIAMIVAAFMAGLGAGSHVGGRLSLRLSPAARAADFRALELGIAAFGAASLLALLRLLYLRAARLYASPWRAGLLHFAALSLPTFLMGMSLPFLVRAMVGRAHRRPHHRLPLRRQPARARRGRARSRPGC